MIDGITERQHSFLWSLFCEYWGPNGHTDRCWWTTLEGWEKNNAVHYNSLIEQQLIQLALEKETRVNVRLTERGAMLARMLGESSYRRRYWI